MNLEEIKERAKKLYKQGTRLDNKGRRPQRVERVFQRAISLDPFNLAYHRRYVCYLLKNERFEEAQEALDTALDLLKNPDGNSRRSLYTLFHKEVAAVAAELNQKDFAVNLLRKVPAPILRRDKDMVQLVLSLTGSKTMIRRRENKTA